MPQSAEKKKAAMQQRIAANPEKERARRKAAKEKILAANPNHFRDYQVRWREKHPEYWRVRHYKEKYGLTMEDFQAMVVAQKGQCGICEKLLPQSPQLDHCHETGKVRGLLCMMCNRGLGSFKDNEASLIRAAEYLRRSRSA